MSAATPKALVATFLSVIAVAAVDLSPARGAAPSLARTLCADGRTRSGDDTVILSCKSLIAANPKDADAHANLCAALSDATSDIDQLNDALLYCDEAVRLAPKSLLAHKNRADVLYRLNRPEDALTELDELVRLGSGMKCPN